MVWDFKFFPPPILFGLVSKIFLQILSAGLTLVSLKPIGILPVSSVTRKLP